MDAKEIQAKYNVKTVFSQNAKMKKSSQNGLHVYNWGMPAYKSKEGTITCPMATHCINGCYARSGAYLWENVANAYENRFKLSQNIADFTQVITYHLNKMITKHKTGTIMIRIHDSSDFYNQEYLNAWATIATSFKNETRIVFYAYTKMVELVKNTVLPSNLHMIFSLGGKQDKMIYTDKDRHSRVFESVEALNKAGYVDASSDDMIALGENKKIGLVFHHAKSYKNTNWDKVA